MADDMADAKIAVNKVLKLIDLGLLLADSDYCEEIGWATLEARARAIRAARTREIKAEI